VPLFYALSVKIATKKAGADRVGLFR
jgi:hypothetical protein